MQNQMTFQDVFQFVFSRWTICKYTCTNVEQGRGVEMDAGMEERCVLEGRERDGEREGEREREREREEGREGGREKERVIGRARVVNLLSLTPVRLAFCRARGLFTP